MDLSHWNGQSFDLYSPINCQSGIWQKAGTCLNLPVLQADLFLRLSRIQSWQKD